jgi:CRISPR-associated protein Csb2
MPLTLSLTFPAGRYVAAAWDDKNSAEWPPHPARLALALLDALHRCGDPPVLRAALLWLCAQAAPDRIVIPAANHASIRSMDGYFVPQNPSSATGVTHSRKPRSFPTVILDPDHTAVFFHWPDSEIPAATREPLARLLGNLPRFGHSSSLVIVGLSEAAPPDGDAWRVLVLAGAGITPDFSLRVPYDGLVKSAEDAYDAKGRGEEIDRLIASALKSAKPGKPLKLAASPRPRHDPRHRWEGYTESMRKELARGPWDGELLILSQTGGTRLGLVSTWQLMETLHKTILDRVPDPVPAWLSGHAPGAAGKSTPSTKSCHLALFPLPSVGHEHADGHLLGVGFALPRAEALNMTRSGILAEWRRALGFILGADGQLELTPKDGSWSLTLSPESSLRPRLAVQPDRWTRGSVDWATVTPLILDRHPKPHFKKDPAGWRASCREIIKAACANLGLPEPVSVEPSPYSPLAGVPAAPAFPTPASRAGRPPRFHVHATLTFAEPILGPLLLGAGRFRGYGLCLPLSSRDDDADLS